uniref:DMRT like family B with proline rich C-terminal 1 n=1 Tax=Capra hircus TaxID=9925 RepID=A0A452FA04_CAPHI
MASCSLEPQLTAEAAGRGYPGCLELRRLPRPVPSPPFTDFGLPLSINSDSVLYPSCSSMHPYRPFPLGYQDASSSVGIPLQQSFQHLSYSHYYGGGLVAEPVGDFQPNYYPPLGQPPLGQPPQPQFLPPGLLSALHFLLPPLPPPPPATFSLTVLSDTDKENTDDQDVEGPSEPSQPSSQEQSD